MITKKAKKYLKLVEPEIVEGSANGVTVNVFVTLNTDPPMTQLLTLPIKQVINRGTQGFWVAEWLVRKINKERRQKSKPGSVLFDFQGSVLV